MIKLILAPLKRTELIPNTKGARSNFALMECVI